MQLKHLLLSIILCSLNYLGFSQFESTSFSKDDYFDFGSQRVILVREALDWIEAVEYAQSKGAILVEIGDLDKQIKMDSFLQALQNKNFDYGATRIPEEILSAAWIGASDFVLEGNWQWNGDGTNTGPIFYIGDFEDGVSYGFHNWGGRQAGVLIKPDDTDSTKNAGAIALTGFLLGSRGEWLDANLNERLYFFMEKDCETDTVVVVQDLCSEESLIFGNDTITTSGEYVYTFFNSQFCDSVVILQVEFHPAFTDTLDVVLCNGEVFHFDEFILDQPGEYILNYQSQFGCDSVLVINFEWLPVKTDTLIRYVCEGDSVFFGDVWLNTSGVYEEIYTDDNQCRALNILDLRVGDFALYFQETEICFGDSLLFGGDYLLKSGIYFDTISISEKCDSITMLRLHVKEEIRDTISAFFCSGDTYVFHGDTLTEQGLYTASLTSIDGCDSLVVLSLSEIFPSVSFVNREVCFGDSVRIADRVFFTTGRYEIELTNQFGCDSTVVLNLRVLPEQFSDVFLRLCKATEYSFGDQIITASGLYFNTFTDSNGCDSLVSLTIDFADDSDFTEIIFDTICSSSFYVFEGDTLFTSGIYEKTFPLHSDCDSTRILHLTVWPAFYSVIDAEICQGESYSFEGSNFSISGSYTFSYPSTNGCDSTLVLNLNVLPVSIDTIQIELCGPEFYVIRGDTIRSSGFYPYIDQSLEGCDSITIYQLNLFNKYETEEFVEICQGESYRFGVFNLTESGVYSGLFVLGPNCDSLITLYLTVHPVFNDTIAATICGGDSLIFNGQAYFESGVYDFRSQSIFGCDSLSVLQLNVNPSYDSVTAVIVCGGDTYMFENQVLTSPGIYTFEYQTSLGCDSILILDLDFIDRYETNISAEICEGESFVIGDSIYREAGEYTYIFNLAEQCDSIVNLNLKVTPAFNRVINASICQGETIEFDGLTLSSAGTYSFIYQTEAGCDSIIEIRLRVNPTYTDTVKVSICGGELYQFEGIFYGNSGIYPFIFQSREGCDSIRVLALTVNSINTTVRVDTICKGEAYVLGDTLLYAGGLYNRTLKNRFGCDSIVFLNLRVIEIDPELEVDGNTLSVGEFEEVRWYRCEEGIIDEDNILGEERTFVATENGHYAAIVFDGTCRDTTACVFVMGVNVRDQETAKDIWISPNPATDRVSIGFNNEEWKALNILNSLGQHIRFIPLSGVNQNLNIQVDDLNAGTYYLKFNGDNTTRILPLIIVK